jgi:hypothetical protein
MNFQRHGHLQVSTPEMIPVQPLLSRQIPVAKDLSHSSFVAAQEGMSLQRPGTAQERVARIYGQMLYLCCINGRGETPEMRMNLEVTCADYK